MDSQLESYLIDHSDAEGDYLYRLYRASNIHTLHGRMVSGALQGRILKMLVRMIRPERILEVGTFSGYSAICMAEGLSDKGHLWTFDINDEMEDFARQWIEQSPVKDRITFLVGDANTEAVKLGLSFDLIFLDGDKRTYVQTYEQLFPLVRQGGFILADNTLWNGHVVDSDYNHDQQTLGIMSFNNHIKQDKRVEKVIVPLRDGLTLIHKL